MKLHRDHMLIDPAYRDILADAGLDTVERVLDAGGDEVVAWSRSTDTICIDLAENPRWRGAVYVKRYHYHWWRSRFKAMLRGTFFRKPRPRGEYDALDVMRKLGIQAVRPIADGERRLFHFVAKCFLITEAVPDSVSLSTFAIAVHENGSAQLPPKRRHRLIGGLARRIRQMHDAGFVHGGLFWRNILLRNMPGGNFEFHFLDASPGKRVWRREVFQPDKIQDIAAIRTLASTFCSKADMARFAKAYLGVDRLTSEQRTWIEQVDQLSNGYRRHENYRLKMNRLFFTHARNIEHQQQAAPPQPFLRHQPAPNPVTQ